MLFFIVLFVLFYFILSHNCIVVALSNDNLESVKGFSSETYALINNFIKQLVPPICFVAYNGNAFDYPILLCESKNVNEVFETCITV